MSTIATSFADQSALPVNGFIGENRLRDLQFKLAHNLQSTLDLHATLEQFFTSIHEAVNFAGMQFNPPGPESPIRFGRPARHTAQYQLKTEQGSVGSICYMREKKFLEAELTILEALTSALFYPLKNALLYRDALQSSMRDALTGIGNRKAMDLSFNREVKLAQRHYTPLSLLVLDVDRFKQLNDVYGHQVGDKALKHVVKVIHATLRETDQVFRYGGEEFVAILNNTRIKDAQLVAERIRMHCAMNPFIYSDQQIFITLSIGVSALLADESTDSLFQRADNAMYQAKKTGRNKVVLENEI